MLGTVACLYAWHCPHGYPERDRPVSPITRYIYGVVEGQHLSSHDSLFLLRHSFSIPRHHYVLRTAPCFLSDVLIKYDNVLREILGAITNVLLPADNPAWLQVSLPVKLGGIGIRHATQIAPPPT